MRKVLSVFIAVCLVLSLFTGVFASLPSARADITEGDYTYTVSGSNATITGYIGSGGAVVIPDTLGGYPVSSIGDSAFNSTQGHLLTSVTIPNSVTSIGTYAFARCTGLTSVTIPVSVTSIGDFAFRFCSSLTSVTIPLSVTSIGSYAFYDCPGLTSVTIPVSVTSIGDFAFSGCTGLTSVTIGSGVISIGKYAFDGCTGLTSVTIPSSVTSIGNYAFGECTGLTSVTIPVSVTSIGNYAFVDCTGLTSVTIGSGVTTIGNYAFDGCTGLTSVTIGSGVISIGDSAFYRCTGLTSVTIPSSVTSIGNYAFSGCTGLTSVTIPVSVTSIGYGAFADCSSLTAAYFLGNAPTGTTDMFQSCATGFTVYYVSSTTGWSNPWYGYPTASFTPAPYILTVNVAGSGSVAKSPDQSSYLSGTVVTLTATPALGYAFTGWSGGLTGTTNPVTIIMDANSTVTATFAVAPARTLTVSVVGSGFVVKSPNMSSYLSGSVVTLTAMPLAGSMFTGWSGDLTGSTNPTTITMDVNKTVTATFAPIPSYVLTTTASPNFGGTIGKSPNQSSYPSGTVVMLAAYPHAGYTFTGWSGDLTGSTNPTTITMDANKTVTATFAPVFSVSLSSGWNLISVPVPLPVASIPGLLFVYGYHDVWSWSVPMTLLPGEGYWVQVQNAVTVLLTGTPETAPVTLTYLAGWQLLGNPFDVPLPISNITNHELITTCYSYDPQSGWGVVDLITGVLQPGKGYWINLSAPTTLTLTHP